MSDALEAAACSGAAPRAPRRWLARFALLAFGFYYIPLIINAYPSAGGGGVSSDGLAVRWGQIFGQVGLWVARNVLGFDGPMQYALNGDNGDTSEEFARLLLGVVIAIVAASIWVFADRQRPGARWVEPALHILLRYAIALGLASYAVAKLLPVQFAPLDAADLEARVGELTPMRLMWAFMQYSRVYSTFAGVMEMLVVVLVAFRRTATIGALLCLVVMTNVALMDACFDVPVKLFSTSMAVAAAALVVFDVRRLVAVLLRRPVPPPVPPDPVFRSPVLRALGWLVKLALIGGVIASSFITMSNAEFEALIETPPPFVSVWRVTSFVQAGRELVGTGDVAQWARLAGGKAGVVIRRFDDQSLHCRPKTVDATRLEIACSGPAGVHPAGSFTWTVHDQQLRLDGTFDGAPVTIALRALDARALPLLDHTTHWISDE